MGFFRGSSCGGGEGKVAPCVKLVRIMLESSNLVRKYKHICSFRKYTFQYQGLLNFTDVSIFLQIISIFWQKQYLYSKQQYQSCVKDFLVLFSVFVRKKVIVNENVKFIGYACGIRLPDDWKLDINCKKDNDITIY